MVLENDGIINPIEAAGGLKKAQDALTSLAAGKTGDTSFKDLFKEYLNDVNAMQKDAEDSIAKLAAGEIKDVHQVMTKVAEAEISFKMMMEIRNKLVSAYQELSKMQI